MSFQSVLIFFDLVTIILGAQEKCCYTYLTKFFLNFSHLPSKKNWIFDIFNPVQNEENIKKSSRNYRRCENFKIYIFLLLKISLVEFSVYLNNVIIPVGVGGSGQKFSWIFFKSQVTFAITFDQIRIKDRFYHFIRWRLATLPPLPPEVPIFNLGPNQYSNTPFTVN